MNNEETKTLHTILAGVLERHADASEADMKARAEWAARAFKAGLAAFDESATAPE